MLLCCFLSRIYIKPQPKSFAEFAVIVVSYLVSTSNHNILLVNVSSSWLFLISYLHQTTTSSAWCSFGWPLFLISYLHQTTTYIYGTNWFGKLFLISYLHQTTTYWLLMFHLRVLFLISYLHQTTTGSCWSNQDYSCFLSRIYIKPQLIPKNNIRIVSCFLSRIYIKPQQAQPTSILGTVVSYLVSTSNHN